MRPGRMPASTNLSSFASPMHDGTHSSSRLAPAPAFFGFTAPLFSAISQIWMGTGGGSTRGCESGNARAKEEDEMAKWQRWERGVRRHSYKALPHLFAFEGFWETAPMICAPPNSPQQRGGPLPGLSRNCSPYGPFIAVIYYCSPNIRRLLCHLLWVSNYYCTSITLVFSPGFVFSKISSCGSGTASALRLDSSPHWGLSFVDCYF